MQRKRIKWALYRTVFVTALWVWMCVQWLVEGMPGGTLAIGWITFTLLMVVVLIHFEGG